MDDNQDLSQQANRVRENSVGYLLRQVQVAMNSAMVRALEPLGVTTDQFKIIMTLTEFDGISQVELARRTGIPAYSVTRNLDALGAQKLVVRKPDRSSRRSFKVSLTYQGKRLSPRLFEVVGKVNRNVLSSLSAEDVLKLGEILSQLNADLQTRS